MLYIVGQPFRSVRLIDEFKISPKVYYGCDIQRLELFNVVFGRSVNSAAADKALEFCAAVF